MSDISTPLDWLTVPVNFQGMCLAYGVTVITAGCAAALNGSTWLTAAVGLTSALMFTTVSVPMLAHYWGLSWPWWLVMAVVWGAVSVVAMRTLIKGGLRVEQRSNDIVDGVIKRVMPTAPEGKTS